MIFARKYRKKPVIVEAVRYDGTPISAHNIIEWGKKNGCEIALQQSIEVIATPLIVSTLEGLMTANVGDYIIRGVAGEMYPCKPDIFAETYYPC